jgi:hypothetical protein
MLTLHRKRFASICGSIGKSQAVFTIEKLIHSILCGDFEYFILANIFFEDVGKLERF